MMLGNGSRGLFLASLGVCLLWGQVGLAQSVLADHTKVDASTIPQGELDAARALTMSFSHASVGGNVWGGLEALATQSVARYSFGSWTDNNRGNPGWQAKVDGFEAWIAAHQSEFAVFQNKFCYIDQDVDFAYYRDSMVKLRGQYPTKKLVWWTIPLQTTGTENALRQVFNVSVRSYAAQNDLPLLDIADIESHKADGTAVTESGNEAMAPEFSSDGGHLNDLGAARVANAMWWLMARLASGGTSGGAGASGQAGAPLVVAGGQPGSAGTGSPAAAGTAGTTVTPPQPLAGTAGTTVTPPRPLAGNGGAAGNPKGTAGAATGSGGTGSSGCSCSLPAAPSPWGATALAAAAGLLLALRRRRD